MKKWNTNDEYNWMRYVINDLNDECVWWDVLWNYLWILNDECVYECEWFKWNIFMNVFEYIIWWWNC